MCTFATDYLGCVHKFIASIQNEKNVQALAGAASLTWMSLTHCVVLGDGTADSIEGPFELTFLHLLLG